MPNQNRNGLQDLDILDLDDLLSEKDTSAADKPQAEKKKAAEKPQAEKKGRSMDSTRRNRNEQSGFRFI